MTKTLETQGDLQLEITDIQAGTLILKRVVITPKTIEETLISQRADLMTDIELQRTTQDKKQEVQIINEIKVKQLVIN
jgi:capsule polysaccharide export protein KpsC/LpsZ